MVDVSQKTGINIDLMRATQQAPLSTKRVMKGVERSIVHKKLEAFQLSINDHDIQFGRRVLLYLCQHLITLGAISAQHHKTPLCRLMHVVQSRLTNRQIRQPAKAIF